MVITINKNSDFKETDKVLLNLKPTRKIFRSEKFLGKVKWEIDALEYQKRMRNEWD
jgi:hypothetical protein